MSHQAYVVARPGQGESAWKAVSRPDPRPGHGEVLVGVRACSLNFRDLMIARGQYGPGVKKELVPLSDGAGEILEVGEGVRGLRAGDRVAGCFFQNWASGPATAEIRDGSLGGALDGMLAERVVLKSSGVVLLPEHLSFEEGAALPCAAVTAWNALMETNDPLKPGATVLTLGSGGVSTFALMFARAAGCVVIATSGSEAKLQRLRQLGAAHAINYTATPDWHAEVLRLTGGRGVDQVIEVGGAQTLEKSLQSLAFGGTISVIGALSGAEQKLGPRQILGRGARVQGIFVGSTAMFENMNRAISVHKLRPVVDEVFPFDRAPDALRKLASGAHFGKIVVSVR